jgi:germination protein YpeB
MQRRKRIRKISLFLAVILVFSLIAVTSALRANELEKEKRASVQQSICELDEYVASIDSSLSKGIYATTPPMILSLSTELWRLSTGAKIMLSQIPDGDVDMSQANKFLSQLGEYMMSLNRKAANGEQLSEKDVKTLSGLLKYAKAFHASTTALRDGVFDGTVEIIKKSGNIPADKTETTSLSVSLENTKNAVTDFPSLIYDGPFSDHLEKKTAVFLNGKAVISQTAAKEKCAEYLSVDESKVDFTGTDEGTVEAYVFNVNSTTCAVTKRGGYLSYIISPEFVGESVISYDEARESAKKHLDEIGYENMVDTYHSESDGVCTVNFAYEENGVRCYPDLIKVSVSMADGRVLSVDARNYLLSHQSRGIGETGLSVFTEAEKRVSPLLHIKDNRLAVIPTPSGDEKLCVEFHCADGDGQEVLVYIDTTSFNEADILLLMYSDNGVLTK